MNIESIESVFMIMELESETCFRTEPQEHVDMDPEVTVKQEPLTDIISAGTCPSNTVHVGVTYDSQVVDSGAAFTEPLVMVKQENLSMDTFNANVIQAVNCTDTYTTSNNYVTEALGVIKPVHVKEEATCENENSTNLYGSETTLSSLYAKQEVKEELVLSPESIQSHTASVVTSYKAEENEPDGTCVVKLAPIGEAEPLPPGGTNTTGSTITSTDCHCDHCGTDSNNHLRRQIQTQLTSGTSTGGDIVPDSCDPTEELLQIEHSRENYMCPKCDFTTTRRKSFETHLKHTGKIFFYCTHCSYTSCSETALKSHKNIHSNEKPFKCVYCHVSCNRKADLIKHEMTHTSEKLYKCNSCNYQCNRKADLQTHQMTHTGEKPFQCNKCEYKSNRKDSLKRHLLLHAREKPFKCSLCDFKSYQKACLRIHQKRHTGEKSFQCSYCDFKCRHKNTLQTHQMRHTGEKPFHCDSCDYRSTRKSDVLKHQRTHSTKRSFKCNGCNRSYRQKRDLTYHYLKRHADEKLFQCNICDYKFRRNIELRRHQIIHTHAKRFECDQCSYVSIYKNAFKRHIEIDHADTAASNTSTHDASRLTGKSCTVEDTQQHDSN